MNRRTVLMYGVGSVGLALSGTMLTRSALVAQEATPTSGVAGLDLPEITISVDDAGFTLPAGVTAGRVLMTVANAGSKPLHFFAARVPDEVTDEQLAKDMTVDEDPPWFDMTKLTFLGTPDWPSPGGQAQGVVDLTAGRWMVVDPIDGRTPAMLTVAEGEGKEYPEPDADVSIGLKEMKFTGLDRPVAAGRTIWKITNNGALDHEIALLPVAPGATKDDVITMLEGMFGGTVDPSAFAPVGGQGVSSKGVTSWQFFDLEPGSYAALCMSPMPGEEFTPHALEGMVKTFAVE